MTDYKQLCADLVAAWDDLPWHYDWKGNLIGLADGCQLDDSAVERARAALAESEPEGPTLDEIDDLCAEHSFCYEDSKSLECLLLIITDALARWGK